MTHILFGKVTWMAFAFLVVGVLLLPLAIDSRKVGRQHLGFPFRFYEHTSAPPPAYGSKFSWPALIGDLVIYYAAAVSISAAFTLVAKH